MTKSRLEAFSDGVFAIAITLLVLDLHVPQNIPAGHLLVALGRQWPSYFAFLVSFLIIGIIWINHHALFDRVREVDRTLLLVNLLLLLAVSVIPFPTRLIAEFLPYQADAKVAVAIYSTAMLTMAVANGWIWLHVTGERNLLHVHLNRAAHRAAIRRFGVGSIGYLVLIGTAFLSPVGTLVVHAMLAVYYCFDQMGERPLRGENASGGDRASSLSD